MKFQSNPELFAECDETVAGAHGRFGVEHGLTTSTPRRSVMPGQITDINVSIISDSDETEKLKKQSQIILRFTALKIF